MEPDWKALAPVVCTMQEVVRTIMSGAGDDAADFFEEVHLATAHRVDTLAEAGVDLHNELDLFAYLIGFSHATTVGHHTLHVYDFCTDQAETPEEECTIFDHATCANLLPLMSLMPLHKILVDELEGDEPCEH